MTSSNEKANQEEGHQDIEEHDNRQRKTSLLQKFVDIIFHDEENNNNDNSSQIEIQNTTRDPKNEDTKQQMVLELQNVDRERKKSLLMRVIDGLLSRSDQSQQELSYESIKKDVTVDSANEEYTTGKNIWGEEGLQDVEKEPDTSDGNMKVDTVKEEDEKRELDIDQEEKAAWAYAKRRQRKNGVASLTDDFKLGLPNLGFEYDRSVEKEKDRSSDTSGLPKPKKSVTISLSTEYPVLSSMKEERGKETKLVESVKKPATVAESSHGIEDERTDSVVVGNNPSATEEKHEVLGVTVLSPIHPSKERCPKSIKDWLTDPNLYKVCNFVVSFLQTYQ